MAWGRVPIKKNLQNTYLLPTNWELFPNGKAGNVAVIDVLVQDSVWSPPGGACNRWVLLLGGYYEKAYPSNALLGSSSGAANTPSASSWRVWIDIDEAGYAGVPLYTPLELACLGGWPINDRIVDVSMTITQVPK
jgi:hypothetical protein